MSDKTTVPQHSDLSGSDPVVERSTVARASILVPRSTTWCEFVTHAVASTGFYEKAAGFRFPRRGLGNSD